MRSSAIYLSYFTTVKNLQNIYNFPHHTNFKWHFTNFSRNWIRSCILPFIIFVWQKSYALKSKVWFSREKKYFWVKLNGHAAFLHIWFWREAEKNFSMQMSYCWLKTIFCLYLFKNEKLMNLAFTPAAKLIKSCTQNWILCIGFGLQLWEERYHNWNVHWGDQTQCGNFRILLFIIFGIAEKV